MAASLPPPRRDCWGSSTAVGRAVNRFGKRLWNDQSQAKVMTKLGKAERNVQSSLPLGSIWVPSP